MTTCMTTITLRLPAPLKTAVQELSKRHGTSMNRFMVVAVAEKVFADRRTRANRAAFDRIMNREGGAPPEPWDELPPDLAHLGPRAPDPGSGPRRG